MTPVFTQPLSESVVDTALALAIPTSVGDYVGARLARPIERTDLLRSGIVAVGGIMTVIFFVV